MASDTLKTYREKRNFKKTDEPKGEKSDSDNIFVIQKHDAQNLHYDFRLSIDGVLKSWAVPRGLSTEANEKRLAIRTEDHPVDYADFEGVIPEDEYGGGTVMVWDKGEYDSIKNGDKSMKEALEDGALKFELKGEKIKGGYAMARTQQGDDDDDQNEQWVIFKLDDKHADARRNPQSTEPDSVLTGRSLEELEGD